jgi:hypothetical protein
LLAKDVSASNVHRVVTSMPISASADKKQDKSDVSVVQADQYHRKLQRILRNSELERQNLSGGLSPIEPRRMSDEMKEATLSPMLVNPSAYAQSDEPLFQCTECDMIVKESDPYCPFCGAIFADGPLAGRAMSDDTIAPIVERPRINRPRNDVPVTREQIVEPERFDIFSMLKSGTRSREMMYQEARKGFAGSARLLEELEHLICDIGSMGTDTTKARRLIGSAWEACRDGDWNLAIALAHQTEEIMEPSVPDLVRTEIARARELLTDAKASGVDISGYILRIKTAMSALRGDEPDEALRLTKELMDSLREDSVSWK